MDEMLEILKALKSGQELLIAKVDGLEMRVAGVEGRLTGVEERLDRIEGETQEIKKGQERQDRILEMLSVKSLETDSYIQDFKRRL